VVVTAKKDLRLVIGSQGEYNSWSMEWREFKRAIAENREPNGSGNDGYAANVIVDAIYKSDELNKPVLVN